MWQSAMHSGIRKQKLRETITGIKSIHQTEKRKMQKEAASFNVANVGLPRLVSSRF